MENDYVIAAVINDAERHLQERLRLRSLRDSSDPFALTDVKFKKLFRLPKQAARSVCDDLQGYPELSIGTIPAHLKILASLHFYAAGSYQAVVGDDALIGLSQPSMCRALEATTNAIVDCLATQHIKFPTTRHEIRQIQREFEEIYNFPGVIGAVDGTHISIFKPPDNDDVAPGLLFYNRKGYYSLNCQVITDAKGRVLSVNPNFPGSTHDSAVYSASQIARHLEQEFLRGEQNQWLLGDKGYPLLPWLMTPFSEPGTDEEQEYNRRHAGARIVVERKFGRLKNKLRCLNKQRTLHYRPIKAARIVIACCTLYNMFFDLFDEDDIDDEDDAPANQNADAADPDAAPRADYLAMGRAKRNEIVRLIND